MDYSLMGRKVLGTLRAAILNHFPPHQNPRQLALSGQLLLVALLPVVAAFFSLQLPAQVHSPTQVDWSKSHWLGLIDCRVS